jgi:NmrA-like family
LQKDKPELKALSAKGVNVIPVDYSSQESIVNALKGVDVVFSVLRDDGLDIQTNVIRAAKDANVKLFVPSEYGRNTFGDKSECTFIPECHGSRELICRVIQILRQKWMHIAF